MYIIIPKLTLKERKYTVLQTEYTIDLQVYAASQTTCTCQERRNADKNQ